MRCIVTSDLFFRWLLRGWLNLGIVRLGRARVLMRLGRVFGLVQLHAFIHDIHPKQSACLRGKGEAAVFQNSVFNGFLRTYEGVYCASGLVKPAACLGAI